MQQGLQSWKYPIPGLLQKIFGACYSRVSWSLTEKRILTNIKDNTKTLAGKLVLGGKEETLNIAERRLIPYYVPGQWHNFIYPDNNTTTISPIF